jgi:hypothetical protein
MPRFRFTIRRMMVAVAIGGAGFAYVRFAIRDYSTWEPMIQTGVPFAALEAYERPQRIAKIASLAAAPPILVAICLVMHGVVRRHAARRPGLPIEPDPPEPE